MDAPGKSASLTKARSSASTDKLSEGSNNLYYTVARADSAAKAALLGGTGVTYDSSSGVISIGQPVGTGDNDDAGSGDTNDNWGLAQFGFNYSEATENVFVPSVDNTLPGNLGDCGPDSGIDRIRRSVSATKSNMRFGDGRFQLSSSTPISVTATARVQETIPLITRYHRSKYLIKAF